jgi:hypothetical protein
MLAHWVEDAVSAATAYDGGRDRPKTETRSIVASLEERLLASRRLPKRVISGQRPPGGENKQNFSATLSRGTTTNNNITPPH